MLLCANADIESKVMGRTPLHIAAEEGIGKVVVTLILGGADIAAMNDEGLTAMDLALSKGHASIANLFLDIDDLMSRSEDEGSEVSNKGSG